jgi:hypothetical protein
MSQQDLNELALPVYVHVSGPNPQSHDWYREHMPHSKTLMEDCLAGFNISSTDLQKLKDEISSRQPNLQGLKSHED